MKTILLLVVTAAAVHAGFRVGDSKWRSMQLEDAVAREARSGEQKTASALRSRVVRLASSHDVELEETDVAVDVDGPEVVVSFQYAELLPLVPELYVHEQVHDITLRVHPVRPLLADDRRR